MLLTYPNIQSHTYVLPVAKELILLFCAIESIFKHFFIVQIDDHKLGKNKNDKHNFKTKSECKVKLRRSRYNRELK